jgi:hypothetical protein
MKNLLFTIAFITSTICTSAQKVYFIYLQSDNYSPFYVKMNERIYSSTVSGYLILSNLVDSAYTFSIGFPSSQSEAKFTVRLSSKDRGFLIKNFNSGLGLFDLQNLTITNEEKDEAPKNISFIKRNDDFSSLLSKAANDTSLLYAVVRTTVDDVTIQESQPKPEESIQKTEETHLPKDTAAIVVSNTEATSATKQPDSVVAIQSASEIKKDGDMTGKTSEETIPKGSVTAIAVTEQSKQAPTDSSKNIGSDTLANITAIESTHTDSSDKVVFKKSVVKKHSESSTSEGFGLVFYDASEDGQDTINLLIPNPPIIINQSSENGTSELQKSSTPVTEIKSDTLFQAPIVVAVKSNSPGKVQCKITASDNDFLKLRKNMAAENTDEAMVASAKKIFKTKCFNTEQIKNLGALFLTSSGKYQFFDAAYLHVTDPENFASLESEIKDEYYLKRFKALIGE